jgi:signal peptide peptidase SppA
MPRDLVHIAARAFNTPLLIHPRKAEVIASVLASRMDGLSPMLDLASAGGEVASEPGRTQMLDRFDGERRGPRITNAWGDSYTQTRYLFRDGLALVTVEGTLVNRGAWIGADSGMTSYEGVAAQLRSAAADRDVSTIVLDLESPGGEAIGAFEMADVVRAIAAEKPVIALVDGMAASAAYAMASAASAIVTTPSGLSGSIGVVLLHLDRSKQMDKSGVSPTLIFAGAHKVDGHPFGPLPDEVRADLQGEIDRLYGMFVSTVAKGRSRMSEEEIRATEARTFAGAEAVAVGLADQVGTLADLVQALKPSGPAGRVTTKGATMSLENPVTPAAQAPIDTAALARDAVAAERKRTQAILASPEAKGREGLAQHLAFGSDMSAEAANAILAMAPVASAPVAPAKNRLDGAVPTPDVQPDEGIQADLSGAAPWASIADQLNKEMGFTR